MNSRRLARFAAAGVAAPVDLLGQLTGGRASRHPDGSQLPGESLSIIGAARNVALHLSGRIRGDLRKRCRPAAHRTFSRLSLLTATCRYLVCRPSGCALRGVAAATATRALFAAGLTATVLVAGGCGDVLNTSPSTAAQWADVAGRDLDCPGKATVRPTSPPQYHDLNNDGNTEAFVDMICQGADPASAPDQLEVFGNRSAWLARVTWIWASPDRQMFLAHGCIYFTGRMAVVIGRRRSSPDPGAAPTELVQQIVTWTGTGIKVGDAGPLQGITDLPPGCPHT